MISTKFIIIAGAAYLVCRLHRKCWHCIFWSQMASGEEDKTQDGIKFSMQFVGTAEFPAANTSTQINLTSILLGLSSSFLFIVVFCGFILDDS